MELFSNLYNYRELLGITENYSYFNNFYIDMMMKLDVKYEAITGNTYLVPYKESFLKNLFAKLLKLLGLNNLETQKYKN